MGCNMAMASTSSGPSPTTPTSRHVTTMNATPQAFPTYYAHVSSPIDSSSPESRSCSPANTFPAPSDGAPAPQQPVWQPPSLEDFEADIRRRQFDPVLQECSDPVAL